MSGVSGVSAGAAELMKVLENNQQQTMELAEKLIKLANTNQVSEAEATGLGQSLDLMA